MELRNGIISLDGNEFKALASISPQMKRLGRKIACGVFREKLEELNEVGTKKYEDLMRRWDKEDQQRRAKNNEVTQEVLQLFTYKMAQTLSEKFIAELDELQSMRH
jgi:hypothetical protein